MNEHPFYVYDLIDPRDGAVFYVGKGKGARRFHHVKAAKRGLVDNAEKFRRIKAIHDDGQQVVERVVSSNATEAEAFAAERSRIAELRSGLTNIVGGVVTNEQRAREQAKVMLGRMKPFDVWMAGIRPEILEHAETHFGGPRAFYDESRSFFQQIAAG